MAYTVIPGAVRFGAIFEYQPTEAEAGIMRYFPGDYDMALHVTKQKFRNIVVDFLEERNSYVTLVLDGSEPLPIRPDALKHVCVSRLQFSIFDTFYSLYYLKSLEHYDKATIWMNKADFDAVVQMLLEREVTGGKPPFQRILDYLITSPGATKTAVKNDLFPDVSQRQFARYWGQAAEIKPEISKPGRRGNAS